MLFVLQILDTRHPCDGTPEPPRNNNNNNDLCISWVSWLKLTTYAEESQVPSARAARKRGDRRRWRWWWLKRPCHVDIGRRVGGEETSLEFAEMHPTVPSVRVKSRESSPLNEAKASPTCRRLCYRSVEVTLARGADCCGIRGVVLPLTESPAESTANQPRSRDLSADSGAVGTPESAIAASHK